MNCQQLVELVTEYLEGYLDDQDRHQLEEHLHGCEDCTHYVEQMQETIKLSATAGSETVDPATIDRLLDTFRSFHSGRL